MSAANLLIKLSKLGIKLSSDKDELKIIAPPGILTSDLREELLKNKNELLELINDSHSTITANKKFLPQPRSANLPLSFAQKRLWFLDALDPGLAVYNIPLAIRLHGNLNIKALGLAFNDLINRHENLRTNFISDKDDQPIQIIHNFLAHIIDSKNMEDVSNEELNRELMKLHSRPFDLAKDSLLRTHILKISKSDHVLLIVMHHIICDAWSIDVLFSELVKLYDGYCKERDAHLEPLKLQYADYALWQNQWLKSPEVSHQISYWKQKLIDTPSILELPTDRPRPSVQSFNGARIFHEVSSELATNLNNLATNSNATLFMVMLAVCQILLSRWSKQDILVVGTPVAGREYTEFENLIGFFINTLPMRADLSEDQNFLVFLDQIKQTTLDGFEHQSLPFEKLVEELQPERDQSHSPIFQVIFMLQNAPDGDDMFSDLSASGVTFDYGTSKFDLNIAAAEFDNGIGIEFEYNTDLFDVETIERFAKHYDSLLKEVTQDPAKPISQLNLLTDSEYRTLVHDWNQIDLPIDPKMTMHGVFEAQVELKPQSIAVYHPDQSLSYKELNRRANVLARKLNEFGVGPETLVGISSPRNPEMITGLLATLKAGGAYVPLDPNYPSERVRFMLQDSQAKVVLTDSSIIENLPEHNAQVICLDDFEFGVEDCPNLDHPITGSQLGYVIYTSGSTGQPKGVCIEHGNVAALITWADTAFNAQQWSGVLASTSICFDLSVFELFCTLGHGGRVVLVDDAFGLPDLPKAAEVSLINTVPSAISELSRINGIPESVKTINLAGEPLTSALVDELYAIPHISTVNDLYGPSEDTTYSTWTKREANAVATIGRPIANTQVYLLDSQLKLVPIGLPGELCLAGSGVTRGYLNRPELTAEKYIKNPFDKKGGKLYRTGDLARYRIDGKLEYLGRLDQQVKLRGFRIELGEIETCLNNHDSVIVARVIIREDQLGDKKLVAYVVPQKDHVNISSLRSHVQAHLPNYMTPQAIVELDEIPLTPNGKLNRKALPAPDEKNTPSEKYKAPESSLESTLVSIWQELLGLKKIGVDDDFFQLGGHSLLAMRVVGKIRRQLGKEISLRTFFARPTIAQLSDQLSNGAIKSDATQISRRKKVDLAPLSYAQQRIWILNEIDPGNPVYNIPWATSISGKINKKALQKAIDHLASRHESLRTSFEQNSDGIRQRILEKINIPLNIQSAKDKNDQLFKLEELSRDNFDLEKAPLIKIHLIECPNNDSVLLINIHHIIADGWSLDVINRELNQLYGAYSRDEKISLPKLPIQYADFAIWQRNWLDQGELNRQLNYWKEKLYGAETVLELPIDKVRPELQSFNGKHLYSQISSEKTIALKNLAVKQNATLYMALLGVFNILLHRYTSQEDILIGSPIAGREQDILENTVGVFINSLALRTKINGAENFQELLKKIKNTTLDAYDNQSVPFERVVEEIQPERDISRSPLFQVMFVLQNAPLDSISFDEHTNIPLDIETNTSKFELTLTAWEHSDGLGLQFEYNTDLFQTKTIEAMARHYTTLVNEIVGSPFIPIKNLNLLGEEEKQKLLIDWNNSKTDFNKDISLHNLIEKQAEENPDAIALIDDEEKITYFELNRRANVLAHYLIQKNINSNSIVGVCVPRNSKMVIGLLGILKTGGAYLPLDPDYPKDRIDFMVKDSEAKMLITDSSLANQVTIQNNQILFLNEFNFEADCPILSKQTFNSQSLAYVIYTSGSTGKPKGVAIEHRSITNFLLSMQSSPGITKKDRFLSVTTLSFDISNLELFGPLISGATSIIIDREIAIDGYQLAQKIDEMKPTIMQATPATWQMLLESGWEGLKQLKILCGGEALSDQLSRRLLNKGKELWNMYGPTETTVWSTCSKINPNQKIDIGRPIANTSCYITDKYGNLCPAGVPGELLIGGAGVAQGYLNKQKLTNERFIENPFEINSGKLYKTGDLAKFNADGKLECLGRLDHQIKLRGFRIELGEIENVLRQHNSVNDCRVIIREDQLNDKRLVAYAIPNEKKIEVSTLREHLQKTLPSYMVPQAIVQIGEIPLTPNGKFDRKKLPLPNETLAIKSEYLAPSSSLELDLSRIWEDLLNLEKIGIRDDFFDLGGHSLLGTRLVARIRSELDKNIDLVTLFVNPTIEKLAEEISARAKKGSPITIPKRQANETIPLSYAQQRIWILDEIDSNSSAYNVPHAVSLGKNVNKIALQEAIDALVARHESLRTFFARNQAEPVQIIAPKLERPIDLISVDSKKERRAKIESLVSQRFDLSKGPLCNFHLIECSNLDPVLLINMHHSISDVWSLDIINRELSVLYNGVLEGITPELPIINIQYADYSIWQRNLLQEGQFDEQLKYWLNKLSGIPSTLEIPTDRPRPSKQTFNGSRVFRYLTIEKQKSIKALSRANNATLFMTLLSVFQVLLYRYSNQEDIVIGTPIANRGLIELENIVGFFLNTLAIRCNVGKKTKFCDLLAKTRETTLEAFANQTLPFEKLVEELKIDRDMSRSPVFQTMFIMQNSQFEELVFEEQETKQVEFDINTTKFDLSLTAWEGDDGIGLQFEYNTDLFDPETIEQMANHYEALLQEVIDHSDLEIAKLALLNKKEKDHILVGLNKTETDKLNTKSIKDMFELQVNNTPDEIALRLGKKIFTYTELNDWANALAKYLTDLGIQSGSRIAICCPRSIELAISALAAVKSGGCYVPIDPTYPEERIEAMLTDSEAECILTLSSLKLPNHEIPLIHLDTLEFETENTNNPSNQPKLSDPLYCIYTSGSTGVPKGVELSHEGLANLIGWQCHQPGLGKAARTLQFASFSFDVSFQELFSTWCTGGELIMVDDALRQDLPALANFITEEGIERLFLHFAALQPLTECWQTAKQTPNLKDIIVAGEQLKITESIRNLFDQLNKAALHNQYGPSETHVVTALTLSGKSKNWPTLPFIGRPVWNTKCYILDSNKEPVPIGIAGELYLGGKQIALGYVNRPTLNNEKFIPSPFVMGDRLYRTGDIARYRKDGNIEFLGRADDQVKLRGYRIELGEIEAKLNQHNNVADARVILREDKTNEQRLVAYVVPNKNSFDVAILRSHLKKILPEYMVPKAIVRLSEIPITPNGKLDQKALPIPDIKAITQGKYIAPSTPVENALAQIWGQLLNVKDISIHDDFFSLGGHSLMTIQLINKLNQLTGEQLSIADIFEHSTIAELAEFLPESLNTSDKIKDLAVLIPEKNILDKTFKTIINFFKNKKI
ncbi:MAG: amino acid adenylation domain-containing protein [Pseudomonadota bacterium]|nr:amino acid adenylation domain-containing protein [Pseudomonadota bacterium]